jgi:iduronate 2-sulfatase
VAWVEWTDHGYALGDNDEWAKQTNFEHATRIPFMIAVPGLAPGRTSALVEQVDLFPTLIEAATMHVAGGATVVPHCPADTQASRATALCTEGFSLVPLLKSPVAPWPKAAFSQVRWEKRLFGSILY